MSEINKKQKMVYRVENEVGTQVAIAFLDSDGYLVRVDDYAVNVVIESTTNRGVFWCNSSEFEHRLAIFNNKKDS